jgi:hypothetical protein
MAICLGGSMSDRESKQDVAVWALTTDSAKTPSEVVLNGSSRTIDARRLEELRGALTGLLDTPLVTLEAYPLAEVAKLPDGGRLLSATSPLALELSNLIARSAGSISKVAPAASSSGETLYRMVVPASVAAQVTRGVVRAMPSANVAGGVRSPLLGALGVVGHAAFVPVAAGAKGGAVAGAAGVAGGAAAVGGASVAITVAAPLVLMAVLAGVSVYAEKQRAEAFDRLTDLVNSLKRENLDREFHELNGCLKSLNGATALLVDGGRIGQTLGVSEAAHTIEVAVQRAASDLRRWRKSLNALVATNKIEVADLEREFPGIQQSDGEFRARIRLALFAVAMEKRLAVLQAVEHGDMAPDVSLVHFLAHLESGLDEVRTFEQGIAEFLRDLSQIQLVSNSKVSDRVMIRSEINSLLQWPTRLRVLAEQESPKADAAGDFEIGLLRDADGNVRVLSLQAVA